MNTIPSSAACFASPSNQLLRTRATWRFIASLAAGFLLIPAQAQTVTSAVPGFISYQGKVSNADGSLVGASPTPVNRSVTFRIWSHPSNSGVSDLIYSEQQTITISDGEFSALIGQGVAVSGSPLGYDEAPKGKPTLTVSSPAVFGDATRYLGVTIDDGSSNADPEISPRQQLVSSAFAFRAKYAEAVGTNGLNTITALDSGNVGIGTVNPSAKLQVAGSVRVGGSGVNIPAISLMANSETVIGLTMGTATSAGSFSTNASAGDSVIRTDNGQSLMLQSGTGAHAMLIDASNEVQVVGKLNANGGFRSGGAVTTHGEGAWLEWNKDATTGKTYLLNQKGSASGGIVFGEVDTANSWTENMVIKPDGRVGINQPSPTAQLEIKPGTDAGTQAIKLVSPTGPSELQIHVGRLFNEYDTGTTQQYAMFEMPGWGNIGVWDNFIVAGRMGIGTTTPRASLEIVGGGNIAYHGYSYLNLSGVTAYYNAVAVNPLISIWTDQRIVTTAEFNVASDARTKVPQGISDGGKDLETLMQVEVTDYQFKDRVAKGSAVEKKLIAQQVEAVYPIAVTRVEGVVPDVYQKAAVTDGWIELSTDLRIGDRVRLVGSENEVTTVVTGVESGRFQTEARPKGGEVFVYGREVDDFRVLDYDAIAMLNVSATQELKREKDEDIAYLVQANLELRQRVAALEASDQAWRAKLGSIERLLKTANLWKEVSDPPTAPSED